MPETFLPYGRQSIDEADIAAVVAVLRSNWLTQGPVVEAFEAALAGRVGAEQAVACANGTAALHLAALALDLGPGDAAVAPANTFLATANAVRMTGAEVAFADIDPVTGLMTVAGAESALIQAKERGWRPRAIFPVHFAGQLVDMPALAGLAAAYGTTMVEDACHALGTFAVDSAGTAVPTGACQYSQMTAFSFHPVKTIAAGEGGAVTTSDGRLAERLRRLRNHGMTRAAAEFTNFDLAFSSSGDANPWYYEMSEIGFNYRLTDIQSALALSQLSKLESFVNKRSALVELYDRHMAEMPEALRHRIRPLGRVAGCRPAWHLYVVQIDFAALGRCRADVMTRLRRGGVGSQVHYQPVAWQPYYRARYGDMALPGAAAYFAGALSLPLFPAMTAADVAHVVQALIAAVGGD